jgi:hypothetical protein
MNAHDGGSGMGKRTLRNNKGLRKRNLRRKNFNARDLGFYHTLPFRENWWK